MKGSTFRASKSTWGYVIDLPVGADGKRRQKKKAGFSTQRDAESAKRAIMARAELGEVVASSRVKLGDYLDDWMESARPGLRPTTIDGYERAIANWIKPRIGHVALRDITPDKLGRFYAELSTSGRQDGQGGLGARSVRLSHQVLNRALGRAARRRLIPTNPASDEDICLPRYEHAPLDVWSAEEARTFLAATEGERLHPLWVLMLATGLRRGEALGLGWEHVDLGGGVVNRAPTLAVVRNLTVAGTTLTLAEPKTNAGRRVVQLRPEVVTALLGRRASQEVEQHNAGTAWQNLAGLVFTTSLGGALDPRNVLRDFQRACVRAGVHRLSLHGLRHTAATLAISGGGHVKAVQEMLGHSDSAITLRLYIHVNPTMHAAASNAIGDALFGSAVPQVSP